MSEKDNAQKPSLQILSSVSGIVIYGSVLIVPAPILTKMDVGARPGENLGHNKKDY